MRACVERISQMIKDIFKPKSEIAVFDGLIGFIENGRTINLEALMLRLCEMRICYGNIDITVGDEIGINQIYVLLPEYVKTDN